MIDPELILYKVWGLGQGSFFFFFLTMAIQLFQHHLLKNK